MMQVLLILLLTGACCALCGVFLVLRRQSMLADSISHTMLLGIVLTFLIVRDIASPWLMVGAVAIALATVAAVEQLANRRVLHRADAIGLVYPVLFSAAILLLSRFARNTHLCMDTVMTGEVIFTALDTVRLWHLDIPRAALEMLALLCVNLLVIAVFFKELKVSAFDAEYSAIIGIPTALLFDVLMGLTAMTAVKAFDGVGAILVLSFFIAPAACACLLTKDLKWTLPVSVLIAAVNVLVGFWVGLRWNLSLSGMCAAVGMLTFLLTLLFRRGGLITGWWQRHENRRLIRSEMFLVHVGNHRGKQRAAAETGTASIALHLHWKPSLLRRISRSLLSAGLVRVSDGCYVLTEAGQQRYRALIRRYHLAP